MKQRSAKQQQEPVDTRVALRLDEPLAKRFHKVVNASKRSKTSIVEECLEDVLPKLERQYGLAA